MMKKTRIGVFDSGIGGFSILREIMATTPGIEIDYISDEQFAPYGVKTHREIVERSELLTSMLLERGAKLVVVACNSATAAAIAFLRKTHPSVHFAGVEPYINILNHRHQFPDIRKAAVITTLLTGRSEKFINLRNKLDPDGIVLHYPMPELATITENILSQGLTESLHHQLKSELAPLQGLNLSHLILGCTHYPLISRLIEEELGVRTVSAAPHVARRVKALLHNLTGELPGEFNYLSTADMAWKTREVEALDHLLRYSCLRGEN